jgi:8-oxo-dGTP pyrophosphatase MutT (NUDIX family)
MKEEEKGITVFEEILEIIKQYSFLFSDQEILEIINDQKIIEGLFNRKSSLHLTASAIVINPLSKRVIMIEHPSLERELFPGGHFELDDVYPDNTALREVKEETGIEMLSLHPWHIKNRRIPIEINIHQIPENPVKKEGPHRHIDFRYVFLTESNHLLPQSDNITVCKWKGLEKIAKVYGNSLYERVNYLFSI